MPEFNTPEGYSLIKTEQLNQLSEQLRALKTRERRLYESIKALQTSLGINPEGAPPNFMDLMAKIPDLLAPKKGEPSPFDGLAEFIKEYESQNLTIVKP